MKATRTLRVVTVALLLLSASACGDSSELDEAREELAALEAAKADLESTVAAQQTALEEQGQTLILQADIVGEGCMLQNAYINDGEAKATFRVRVFDPLTGAELGDGDLEGVTVILGDGQEFEMRYGPHPPDGEDPDFFWAYGWVIFDGYPAGNVSYTIQATALDGRTGEFKPFNVAPSLLTVMDA